MAAEYNRLGVRVLLFLLLIAACNLWAAYHLGFGIENSGLVGAAVAAIGGGLWFLDWLLSKQKMEAAQSYLRRQASVLLAPRALVLLWIVAIGLALCRSSVVVVPPPGMDDVSARLMAVRASGAGTEAASLSGERPVCEAEQHAGPLRCGVWTGPFGRLYELRVSGYLRDRVEVFPVLATTIRPERDLQPAPSVLLRPPVGALDYLADGGKIVVACPTCSPPIDFEIEWKPIAVLVGRTQSIPGSLVDKWRLELAAEEADQKDIPRALLAWIEPEIHQHELRPGAALTVEIRSRKGKILGQRVVEVGADSLTDVLIDVTGE